MFGIVFAILIITIIILVCWHTLNPLKRVIEYIRDEVKFYCDTDVSLIFTISIVQEIICKILLPFVNFPSGMKKKGLPILFQKIKVFKL